MAPYITTDMPMAQVPVPVPGYGQSPPASGVYMQEINGVTYFSQTPFPMPGVQVYPSEHGSSGYSSPHSATAEGDHGASSPEHWSQAPDMSHHQPSSQAPVVYTTAPSQPVFIQQPQMMTQVMMPPMPTAVPVPQQVIYQYQVPAQQYSPGSTAQYCTGSPILTASSTPSSGPSPAPPTLSGSRASTPPSLVAGRPEHGVGESLSTRLEVVWHGKFDELFKNYMHKWNLAPIADPRDLEKEDLNRYMDSAKVRFICPNCKNCWTSMKGRIFFLYVLDHIANEGYVFFKLFGQKCSKCPDKDYVHSLWYPDEIEKVIANIHQKVGQTYYGVKTPIVRVDRRFGHPKKPHPPMSCQACDLGICREEHNFR